MPRFAVLPLLTLLIALLPAAAQASEAPALPAYTAGQLEEMQGGEVMTSVEAGEPNRGEAVGVFRAAPEQIRAVLLDWDRLDTWSPAAYDVRITGRDGDAVLVSGMTDIPMLPDRSWQIRTTSGEQTVGGVAAWVLSWTYVRESGNLDDTFGYWLVYALPEAPEWSLVRYVVNADAGLPIPDSIINWATNRTLPTLFARLAEQVGASF
jgi:hypothetical protein